MIGDEERFQVVVAKIGDEREGGRAGPAAKAGLGNGGVVRQCLIALSSFFSVIWAVFLIGARCFRRRAHWWVVEMKKVQRRLGFVETWGCVCSCIHNSLSIHPHAEIVKEIVQLYARSGQLDNALSLSNRLKDIFQPWCRFGCSSLDEAHHIRFTSSILTLILVLVSKTKMVKLIARCHDFVRKEES